jgi:hypothetical protein
LLVMLAKGMCAEEHGGKELSPHGAEVVPAPRTRPARVECSLEAERRADKHTRSQIKKKRK